VVNAVVPAQQPAPVPAYLQQARVFAQNEFVFPIPREKIPFIVAAGGIANARHIADTDNLLYKLNSFKEIEFTVNQDNFDTNEAEVNIEIARRVALLRQNIEPLDNLGVVQVQSQPEVFANFLSGLTPVMRDVMPQVFGLYNGFEQVGDLFDEESRGSIRTSLDNIEYALSSLLNSSLNIPVNVTHDSLRTYILSYNETLTAICKEIENLAAFLEECKEDKRERDLDNLNIQTLKDALRVKIVSLKEQITANPDLNMNFIELENTEPVKPFDPKKDKITTTKIKREDRFIGGDMPFEIPVIKEHTSTEIDELKHQFAYDYAGNVPGEVDGKRVPGRAIAQADTFKASVLFALGEYRLPNGGIPPVDFNVTFDVQGKALDGFKGALPGVDLRENERVSLTINPGTKHIAIIVLSKDGNSNRNLHLGVYPSDTAERIINSFGLHIQFDAAKELNGEGVEEIVYQPDVPEHKLTHDTLKGFNCHADDVAVIDVGSGSSVRNDRTVKKALERDIKNYELSRNKAPLSFNGLAQQQLQQNHSNA
jgi:hypothetical protein